MYARWLRLSLQLRVSKFKSLVLTFDDGPGNKLTPSVLEILSQYNAKATFFLLGRNIADREEIVKRIAEKGHEICSHGYAHLHHWRVSPVRSLTDIKKGWQAIDRAIGQEQGIYPFRPPYGKLNLVSLLYLWFRGAPVYYWTLDTGDTWPAEKRSGRLIDTLIMETGGAVTLAHDFDRKSDNADNVVLETLCSILSVARETGMRIRTISEFMTDTEEG